MKLTTYISCGILILFGFFACAYALTGFDTLFFLCAGKIVIYRSLLSLAGIAGAWLLFWLIAFRPAEFLN